jgi:hypothetical protein
MTREEMAEAVRSTVQECNTNVQAAILAGNATNAADWAGALKDAAIAYVELSEDD